MPFQSNRWLTLAGLGALVVLNVVLIALLLVRPTAPSSSSGSTPAPTQTDQALAPEETEPPLSQADADEPSETGDTPAIAPASRIIVNADDTHAWRAKVGDCTSPATLEHTTDQGETWQEVPLDLAPLSRMRVLGQETLFAIGGGADCAATYLSSSTAGTSWLANDQYLEGSWYLMPADRNTMATPAGEIETPCEPVELAALDTDHGAVLCMDATLQLTEDGGNSWSRVETPALDASALGVATDGYVLAGAAEGCGGELAVSFLDTGGVGGDEPVCTGVVEDADPADVAVSAAADVVWLWTGNDVVVSANGAW